MIKSNQIIDPVLGWRFPNLSLVSGAVASLALPPTNFWPALFISFPLLVLVLDRVNAQQITSKKRFFSAFLSGWWFGFGYFGLSLFWIGNAFLVEADKFLLLMPFAIAALPAGLAIFWGLAAGLAMTMWRPGIYRLLALACTFTLLEWLRGHVLTGFPWNTIGYTSTSLGNFDQLAAFSGLYGLTFFVLTCSLVPVLFLDRCKNYPAITIIMLMFAATWVVGENRVSLAGQQTSQKKLLVRVIQPNIDQVKKWNQAYLVENIEKYFELTTAGPESSKTHLDEIDVVIWPESALPLRYGESKSLQDRVGQLLPDNTKLIMGAVRREATSSGNRFFNSVLVINSSGKTQATFDKFHLVPFGEYLPGEKWLTPLGLRKIVTLPGGFNSGSGPKTIKVNDLPAFSALICYEIVFADQIVDPNHRPDWIVNVTNDGWFGNSAGPHQHLEQARFRAIEQGLPVIRAANTGISAVIDPYGRVIAKLPLGSAGVLDSVLPAPLDKTIYARFGDWAAVIQILVQLALLTTITILLSKYQKRRKRHARST